MTLIGDTVDGIRKVLFDCGTFVVAGVDVLDQEFDLADFISLTFGSSFTVGICLAEVLVIFQRASESFFLQLYQEFEV